ncbi:unnamed protein product [Closterium sp. NIES-65]|nr:unnamed protein product [Closterium sp. NIES-65]
MYHSQLRWERKRDKAAAVRPPTERSAAKEAMARAMLGEIEEHDERQHERGHPLERRWVYPWEEDDERPAVYAEQEEIWLPAEREEESVDKKREDFGWLEEAIERQRRREREEREFGYIGFALMAATKETASVTETAGSEHTGSNTKTGGATAMRREEAEQPTVKEEPAQQAERQPEWVTGEGVSEEDATKVVVNWQNGLPLTNHARWGTGVGDCEGRWVGSLLRDGRVCRGMGGGGVGGRSIIPAWGKPGSRGWEPNFARLLLMTYYWGKPARQPNSARWETPSVHVRAAGCGRLPLSPLYPSSTTFLSPLRSQPLPLSNLLSHQKPFFSSSHVEAVSSFASFRFTYFFHLPPLPLSPPLSPLPSVLPPDLQGFSSSPFAFFSSPSLCQPLPACFPLTLSRPSPLPFSLFPHLLSSPFAYSPTSPTSFPSGAFLASLPGGSRGSSLRPWSAAPHHPPQPHLATLLATSALLSTSPNVPYQEHFLSRSLVAAGVLLFALALLLLHVSHNPHFATLLANSPFLPPSPHLFHRPSHHKPFLSRSLVAAGGLLFSLGLLLIPLRASPILSLSSSLYHLPPGAFLESLPGGSRGSALFPWSASPSRLPQPPLCQPACNA